MNTHLGTYLAGILGVIIVVLVAPNNNVHVIEVPVKAHLIVEGSGYYTSERDEENIKGLFVEVNRIWKQADIVFIVEEVVKTEVSAGAVPKALALNFDELGRKADPHKINVFFAQSLNNINGIALVGKNAAVVADRTTVNDFRTTAHEIGHLFGLPHVGPDHYLMAQGRNGEFLTEAEIRLVRETLLATR